MNTAEQDPLPAELRQREANHVPLSPLSFLERSARVYPDKVAVVHGDQRQPVDVGNGFRHGTAHEQRADEPGPLCDGDPIQVRQSHARVGERSRRGLTRHVRRGD